MDVVPSSHQDLLDRPLVAALSTLTPSGYAQTHPVWFSAEGPWLQVNTMRGFFKERNMRADPRVTLLVVDPGPDVHWLEVRGRVELVEAGAREHLDALALRYTGTAPYFGEVVPAELATSESPVIGRIAPLLVVTDLLADAATERRRPPSARPVPPAPRPAAAGPVVPVPGSHRELLAAPYRAVLTTLMPDGHPQTQPVWCGLDGDEILVTTTRERREGRNLLARPRATVLVVDPADTSRWIEVRGDVTITQGGAERRGAETHLVCRIHPRHVVCDAIHR